MQSQPAPVLHARTANACICWNIEQKGTITQGRGKQNHTETEPAWQSPRQRPARQLPLPRHHCRKPGRQCRRKRHNVQTSCTSSPPQDGVTPAGPATAPLPARPTKKGQTSRPAPFSQSAKPYRGSDLLRASGERGQPLSCSSGTELFITTSTATIRPAWMAKNSASSGRPPCQWPGIS